MGCREIKTGAREWTTLGTLTFQDQKAKKSSRKKGIQDQIIPEENGPERLLSYGGVWSELSALWRHQGEHTRQGDPERQEEAREVGLQEK